MRRMINSPGFRKSGLPLFIGIAGLLISGEDLSAQEPPRPAWIDELTPISPGPFKEIRPAVATFKLSWNNAVNAGEAYIVLDQSGAIYKGEAAGRSIGIARALWPYEFTTNTETEVETLLPLGFTHEDVERKERVIYASGFDRSQGKVITDTTFFPIEGGGEPDKSAGETKLTEPETKRRVYEIDEIMDLLSTVLFVRSLELKEGDDLKLVVFPMNRPYHVEMKVLGREERTIKDESFNTIKLDIQASKVKRDLTLEPYEKIKKVTLWVTDDELRLPLDLQAEIFVGFISARSAGMDWIEADESIEDAVKRVRKTGLKGSLAKEEEETASLPSAKIGSPARRQ